MRIDRIESSRHKKGRVLVFLEDGACLKITEQELLDFGLRSGDELSPALLAKLKEAAGISNTKATAADLIGKRAMSRAGLEKKLREKGASQAEARYAGEWLEAIGALNDIEYAAILVRHYGQMGYGPRYVQEKLRDKGVPRELWEDALEELPEAAEDEAAVCLAESLARCPALHVTLDPGRGQGVLRKAAERSGLTPETVLPMNVYACRKLQPLPLRGRAVVPREEHRPVMAALLRQMALDAEGQEVPEAAAADFAQAMVGSDRLLLWEDGDIRAMAMIAHIGGGMGRINTVVTERNSRGRGYAGMLTAALCEKLLAQGLTPMLYADAGNPSSNRAYQKIGMEARGQVAEYRWK